MHLQFLLSLRSLLITVSDQGHFIISGELCGPVAEEKDEDGDNGKKHEPDGERNEEVRDDLSSNCSLVRARGSRLGLGALFSLA